MTAEHGHRLGFALDKSRWGSLCDQIADGFRTAIRTGVYRAGDRLPGRREIAAHFDVSVRVVTRAFKLLADEGVVVSRPGAGCTVLAPKGAMTKGLVLLVVPGGDYLYYANIRVGRVFQRLSREGYLVLRVGVPSIRGYVYDTRSLDVLLSQTVRLVVMMDPNETIIRHLDKLGVKYVVVGGSAKDQAKGCLGRILHENSQAFADMAAAAQSCGVRNAAVFGIPKAFGSTVEESFRARGIGVSDYSFRSAGDLDGHLDEVRVDARNAMRKWLAKNGKSLPDMVFFGDEYRAEGGLLALHEAGLSVPDDVSVVSVSNIGNAPVLSCSLASIEYDPFADGDRIAEVLMAFLSTEKFPENVVLASRFVSGKSLSRHDSVK